MRNLTFGSESHTDPGSGVRIYGTWKAEASREDRAVIHLLEEAHIHCPIWLAWYIKATMTQSHRTLHDRFKKHWEQQLDERIMQPPQQA